MATKRTERLLHGKAVVVIGGTAGLGLSAVKAFIAAGARTVAVGRDPAKVTALSRELGARARVISGDAAQPETAPPAIQQPSEAFSRNSNGPTCSPGPAYHGLHQNEATA